MIFDGATQIYPTITHLNVLRQWYIDGKNDISIVVIDTNACNRVRPKGRKPYGN